MHRVHNLFPADCAAPTYLPFPPAPTLIDNVFSRARDSRVFFVTARLFRPKTRLKIKSRWKNSGDALTARRCEVCTGEICAARILVSGTSAFHFRPANSENNSGCTYPVRTGTRRLEFREASHAVGYARRIPFVPRVLFFPFPFAQNPRSRWCLTTVLQPVRQSRRMQNLGAVTRETRETIKTS